MDWRLVWIQGMMYLLEKFGPVILDAIGNLLVGLIKSLTPAQQEKILMDAGLPQEVAKSVLETPTTTVS